MRIKSINKMMANISGLESNVIFSEKGMSLLVNLAKKNKMLENRIVDFKNIDKEDILISLSIYRKSMDSNGPFSDNSKIKNVINDIKQIKPNADFVIENSL